MDRLSRRAVLRLGASIPFALLTCRDSHSTNFDALDNAANLKKLDPRVQRQLETKFGKSFPQDQEQSVLLNFLLSAETNDSLVDERPLCLRTIGARFEREKIDVARQLSILENESYFFLTLGGSTRLAVITWSDEELSQAKQSASQVADWTRYFLPKLDVLFDGLFSSEWLHIQLFSPQAVSSTMGYNLFLARKAESSVGALVHELVHTYNYPLSDRTPTFVTEGIPEVVARFLTGESVLQHYATEERVELKVFKVSDAEYFRESGNGFFFFSRVLGVMGSSAFFDAVSLIWEQRVTDGLLILRVLKNMSVDKAALEELYIRSITAYVPGSA